ncbi:SET domain-containing protein [Polyplosphaeria fusca]|uniref:SET domain-containing protein n=1 Tax=Polyplosphaeria fusca TaxID=682080 RepID=A0A9P4V4I9_9PLEO|nr:SET domain-containing protein [Polyplosphaeria fusca]
MASNHNPSSNANLSAGESDPVVADLNRGACTPHEHAARLEQWFHDCGGELHQHVQVAYDSNQYSLKARAAIASSTVIAKCPLRLTLSHLSLDHTQSLIEHVDSPLQRLLNKVPDVVLTYLFLIEQRSIGRASPWAPYIACLPTEKDLTTPLWFNEDDFSFLDGTNIRNAAGVRLAELETEFDKARRWMKFCKFSDEDMNVYSFESFKWAATIMSSRAFSSKNILPERKAFTLLYPVIDIANHSLHAHVGWDFNTSAKTFGFQLDEDVALGEEIFNNYGPKGNDELLMGYGFCLPDNEVEQYSIKLPSRIDFAKEQFDPKAVPFNMDVKFLTEDTLRERQYLRFGNHPFKLYKNSIPVFCYFPEYTVFTMYLETLNAMDIDSSDGSLVPDPGGRVVIGVLKRLFEALKPTKEALKLDSGLQATNAKQRAADIFRRGQASIVHNICSHLASTLDGLKMTESLQQDLCLALQKRAGIVKTEHIIQLIELEHPRASSLVQEAVAQLRNSQEPNPDLRLWELLLTTCYLLTHPNLHTTDAPQATPRTILHPWIRTLLTFYSLPAPPPPLFSPDTPEATLSHLFAPDSANAAETAPLIPTDPPLLRTAISWAQRIAAVELIALPDETGTSRLWMYMEPSAADGDEDDDGEKWMFR